MSEETMYPRFLQPRITEGPGGFAGGIAPRAEAVWKNHASSMGW